MNAATPQLGLKIIFLPALPGEEYDFNNNDFNDQVH